MRVLVGRPPSQAPWAHACFRRVEAEVLHLDFNTGRFTDEAERQHRRSFFDLMVQAVRHVSRGITNFDPASKMWKLHGDGTALEVLRNFLTLGFFFVEEEVQSFFSLPSSGPHWQTSGSVQPRTAPTFQRACSAPALSAPMRRSSSTPTLTPPIAHSFHTQPQGAPTPHPHFQRSATQVFPQTRVMPHGQPGQLTRHMGQAHPSTVGVYPQGALLRRGAEVRIHSLTSHVSLNGRVGVLRYEDEPDGEFSPRWVVDVGLSQYSLAVSKLELLDSDVKIVGVDEGPRIAASRGLERRTSFPLPPCPITSAVATSSQHAAQQGTSSSAVAPKEEAGRVVNTSLAQDPTEASLPVARSAACSPLPTQTDSPPGSPAPPHLPPVSPQRSASNIEPAAEKPQLRRMRSMSAASAESAPHTPARVSAKRRRSSEPERVGSSERSASVLPRGAVSSEQSQRSTEKQKPSRPRAVVVGQRHDQKKAKNKKNQRDSGRPPVIAPAVVPPAVESQVAECALCLDAPVSIVFVPCGHMAVCGDCSKSLGNRAPCPICRKTIKHMQKVFMA